MDNNEKLLFSSWIAKDETKTPLYKQIANYIKDKVDNGDINVGYKFPTYSVMEKHFQTSKFTLSTCFDLLQAEGYVIQNHARRFIVDDRATKHDVPNVDWQHFMKRANHTVNMPHVVINTDLIDSENKEAGQFIINCDEFDFRKVYTKAIGTIANEVPMAINLHIQSDPNLLKQLSYYLEKRDIFVNPSQILIVQNLHTSTYLISIGLLSSSSTLIATKPSGLDFFTAREITRTQTVYVKTDNEGIVIDDLYSKIKTAYNPILYVEPCYAHPSGLSMGEERKHEIVDLCAKLGVPILEFDNQRDYSLNYHSPMKSFDISGNIIYQTSLGTQLNYNCSIGIIVGNEYIINHLAGIYSHIGPKCTSLVQSLYLELLQSGGYEKCIEDLKPKLHKRLIEADQLLKRYLSSYASWEIPSGGVYFNIKFNSFINIVKIEMPSSKCYYHFLKDFTEILLVTVASCTLPELEEFIAHLAKECEKQVSRKSQ